MEDGTFGHDDVVPRLSLRFARNGVRWGSHSVPELAVTARVPEPVSVTGLPPANLDPRTVRAFIYTCTTTLVGQARSPPQLLFCPVSCSFRFYFLPLLPFAGRWFVFFSSYLPAGNFMMNSREFRCRSFSCRLTAVHRHRSVITHRFHF